MDLEIRKANLKDLDALFANRMLFIEMLTNQEASVPEEFKKNTYEFMQKHIDDDSMVTWLAIEGDAIASVAIVCYYQLLPTMSNITGNTGYILNVFTLPDYRKKGLATELVNKIIQDAKERNVGRLILSASDMGRPVYEKIGFEATTKEMIYTVG
jgi:GNAT superfamily N-acetyltransferase